MARSICSRWRSSVSIGQISSRTNSRIQSSCAWNSGSVEKSHAISLSFVASSGRRSLLLANDPEPDRTGRRATERVARLRDELVAPRGEPVVAQPTREVERVGTRTPGDAEAPPQRYEAHARAVAAVGTAGRDAPPAHLAPASGDLDVERRRRRAR